jgi:hypothetical protein
MYMNTSEQILVIALGIMLAIFLLLSILVVAQALRLVANLRRISDKAEKVLDSAESAAELWRKSAAPVSMFRFVRSVAETAMQHKKEHHKK